MVVNLVGIPQVYRELNGTYPTGATLSEDGTLVEITYGGAAITSGERFTWGPYDPAVRTPQGGYANAGQYTAPPQTPTQIGFTANQVGSAQIDITWTDPLGGPLVFDPVAWLVDPPGPNAINAAVSPNNSVVAFDADISLVTTIQYTGPAFSTVGEEVSVPSPAPVEVEHP